MGQAAYSARWLTGAPSDTMTLTSVPEAILQRFLRVPVVRALGMRLGARSAEGVRLRTLVLFDIR